MNEIEVLVTAAASPQSTFSEKQDAFCELVERFQDMAYGYAYAILGESSSAQDAAQEAFIEAYRHLDQLREVKAFPGWLRQIVHSQSHRLLREAHPGVQPLESLPEVASDQPGPPGLVERQELREQIWAEIYSLPESQRVPTVLYYINGYSQGDVAVFLNESTDAVKKQIQRARDRLQERMMDMVKDNLNRQRPSRDSRFLEAVKTFTALKTAADDSQIGMVELMLLDGLDINAQDEDGLTLLHLAARQGSLDLAQFLIAHGAQTDILSAAGKTPLQEAADRGFRDLAEILRK